MRVLIFSLAFVSCALASVQVRDACGEDSTIVATIQDTDPIQVNHGVVGESVPCYAVSVKQGSGEVRGYVLGNTLPAIADFERRRAAESRIAIPAPPPEEAKAKKAAVVSTGPPFEPWTGVDIKGKKIHIGDGTDKVYLVTFWSAQSQAGRRTAENVQRFRLRGVNAFGLVRPTSFAILDSYLDDMGLNYPLAFDRDGLAAKYNADPNKGTTLVIDSSNHIVASSSNIEEIRAAVTKLLSSE
jgi:hypothetical protein